MKYKYGTTDVQHGRSAERILEDPLFAEACLDAERQCIARWRAAKTTAERERAHAELMGLEAIVRHLRTVMQRGDLAAEVERRENERSTSSRRTTVTRQE